MKPAAILALGLASALALSSCKLFYRSGVSELTLPSAGQGKVELQRETATIGSDGGRIALAGSAGGELISLEIPQGALASAQEISIVEYEVPNTALGNIFALEPAGTRFSLPLSLTIEYGDYLEKSGLSAFEVMLYQLSDSGYLTPVFGAKPDTESGAFRYALVHFSGVVVGPDSSILTEGTIAKMAEIAGVVITPEYIARCEELWKVYTEANTDYLNRDSFAAGWNAVKAWCEGRSELAPARWTGLGETGDRANKVVAGFELHMISDIADLAPTPPLSDTYNQRSFSGDRRGDLTPSGGYFVAMPGQIREVVDTANGISTLECFDIYVWPTLSPPRLQVAQSDLIYLAEGEIQSIEATADYHYYVHGVDIDQEEAAADSGEGYAGFEGAEVSFAVLEGQGSLAAASSSADATGRAQTSFTAHWGSQEIEPETCTIRVSLTHGDFSVTKDIVVTEKAGQDLAAPIPGGSGALSWAIDANEDLVLGWSAATDEDTPQAELEYRVISSGSANLATLPDAEANGSVVLDWTKGMLSAAVPGSRFIQNSYYAVLVREAAGSSNSALYTQSLAPIVEEARPLAYGTYTLPGDSSSYLYFKTDGTLVDCGNDWGATGYSTETNRLSFVSNGTLFMPFCLFVDSAIAYQDSVYPCERPTSFTPLGLYSGDVTGQLEYSLEFLDGGRFAYSALLLTSGEACSYPGSWSLNQDNSLTADYDSGELGLSQTWKYGWVKNGLLWYFVSWEMVFF